MNDHWKRQVLELKDWKNKEEAIEYARVVEEARDRCDLDTCKLLMRTFVSDDDYGVQESVFSVLSTAMPQDRQIAILEELPRLTVDAPEMAEDLVEIEISSHLDSLRNSVQGMRSKQTEALVRILGEDYVRSRFPNLRV